jgi:hypothetical protein
MCGNAHQRRASWQASRHKVGRNFLQDLFQDGKFILGWSHRDAPVKVIRQTLTCHSTSRSVKFSEILWDGSDRKSEVAHAES